MAYESENIAKDLTIALLEQKLLHLEEPTEAADAIGKAYQQIYKYVSWQINSDKQD